ncbi:MAG: DMT family transporter [Terriglobales bacterium]
MLVSSYVSAILSLAAVGAWGTSDFLGGLGARRANVFLFTSAVHLCGMVLACALAVALSLPFPDANAVHWSLAAGAIGGAGLAFFYRALAIGKMGLVAPLSAVLGAAIATAVTAFAEGAPSPRHLLGFLLAGVGVWLISRTEDSHTEDSRTKDSHTQPSRIENNPGGSQGVPVGAAGAPPVQAEISATDSRPQGLGLAILAGCGFAGFFLCVHRAGNGSALWIAVCSRVASFIVTSAIVLAGRQLRPLARPVFGFALGAGILDITGTVVFVRAAQIGRLDAAVVLSSLYPAVTVILARIFLKEHFSRYRTIGMLAALAAVPMIAR